MTKIHKKALSIGLSVALLSSACVFAAEKAKTINPGWFNVLYLGATVNDEIDDTSAIKEALRAGAAYLPEGEYIITDTLDVGNRKIVGDGSGKTIITADIKDPNTPILNTWRTSLVEGITIRFKDGLVTGEEKEWERLGIDTAGVYASQRGTRFTDVVIENVGTGIASGVKERLSADGDAQNNDKDDEGFDTIFSVTFDQLTVKDFSFRGIDFRATNRTGNYFNEITLSSGKYRADSALYWVGEESETAIGKLTIKDTIAETPVFWERMNNVSAGEIIFDNVYSLHYPLFNISSSVILVDYLTFDYSDVHFSENPMIQIGSTEYAREKVQTLNSMKIGTLKLNSLNSNNALNLFGRANHQTTPYYITVDEYIVKNSDYDWFYFPADETNLIITKKGEIATSGPTSDRPEERLCPYYSRYFDTDLNKTVVWTGEEWK